jgi:hypothetical protein
MRCRAKRAEGCSERYIQDSGAALRKFAREFPRLIATVRGFEIKTWLQERRGGFEEGRGRRASR